MGDIIYGIFNLPILFDAIGGIVFAVFIGFRYYKFDVIGNITTSINGETQQVSKRKLGKYLNELVDSPAYNKPLNPFEQVVNSILFIDRDNVKAKVKDLSSK